MENDSFRLIVRRGPQVNEAYELTGDVSNLGRDITNDIVINDREVSRHHLRLTRGADGYTIEDLGSTNGTFVNGKRVSGATALKNGDMVGLGETVTLQFEAGRPGMSAPPPAQQQNQPAAPSSQGAQQGNADAAYQRPQAQGGQAAPQQAAPAPQQAASPPQQGNQYQPPQQQPAAQYNEYDNQPGQYQDADAYAPPQDYYNQEQPGMQGGGYGPPPPGYDYDPYAMRDEGGNSTTQWILIGCLGLLLLCCCFTVVAAVAVDSLCLYDSIPVLRDILRALAIPVNCPA